VIRQSQGERKRRFFISSMGIICLRRSAWPALPQRAWSWFLARLCRRGEACGLDCTVLRPGRSGTCSRFVCAFCLHGQAGNRFSAPASSSARWPNSPWGRTAAASAAAAFWLTAGLRQISSSSRKTGNLPRVWPRGAKERIGM